MKISLFLSGHVRTLFCQFHKNLNIIRENIGECEIDIFYSFWDDFSRGSLTINDPSYFIADNFIEQNVTINMINEYFLKNNVNYVDGEIESSDLIKNILNDTPFLPEKSGKNILSSPYYKKNRVVEKYLNDGYDLYVYLRPDSYIKHFPTKEIILGSNNSQVLLIDSFYWYGANYDGKNCSEVVYASTDKKVFEETNSVFKNQERLSRQLSYHYGESVFATHCNNLVESKIIRNIQTFNFEWGIIR